MAETVQWQEPGQEPGQEEGARNAQAARLRSMAAKMTAAAVRGAFAMAQGRLAEAQRLRTGHAVAAQQQVVALRAAAARLQAEEEALTAQEKQARARTFQAAAVPSAASRYRRSPSPATRLAAAAEGPEAPAANAPPESILAGVLSPYQLVQALRALPSKALAPPMPLDLPSHEHEPLRAEPDRDGLQSRPGPSRGSRAGRRINDAMRAGDGDGGGKAAARAALPPVRQPRAWGGAKGDAKKRRKHKIAVAAAAAAAAGNDDGDITELPLPVVRRPVPFYSMRSSADGAATSVDALRKQRQQQQQRQQQLQQDIFALVNDQGRVEYGWPGGADAEAALAALAVAGESGDAARQTSSGRYVSLSSNGGDSRGGSADRPTRWRGLEEGAGLGAPGTEAQQHSGVRGASPVPGAAPATRLLSPPRLGSAPATRAATSTSTGGLSNRSQSPVPFGYDPDATAGYQEAWLRKLNALVASNRFSTVSVFKKAVKVISSRLNIPRLHEPVASAAQAGELVGRMTGHGLRSPGASPPRGSGGGGSSPHRQQYSDAEYCKPFTIAEYFCALADAEGDLDRAVDRLRKREFAAEVRHVCGPVSGVDVYGTLRKVGGGIEALLRQEQQTIEDLLCARFSTYVDKDEERARPLVPLTARSYLSIAATE